MELRAYLDTLPRGGVAEFAGKCGISEVYLHQLAARQGRRQASPALAVVIERESGGMVKRADLRPDDYSQIWPDLKKPAASKKADAPAASTEPRIPAADHHVWPLPTDRRITKRDGPSKE